MGDIPQEWVEKAAQVIYPDVMNTWEDQWPTWEYADDGQADFMRDLARAVLAAVLPDVRRAPAVDREALAAAMTLPGDNERDRIRNGHRAAVLMADLPLQDAADVRRAVAEEIAADLEFKGKATDRYGDHDYYRAARIAREAGGRDE